MSSSPIEQIDQGASNDDIEVPLAPDDQDAPAPPPANSSGSSTGDAPAPPSADSSGSSAGPKGPNSKFWPALIIWKLLKQNRQRRLLNKMSSSAPPTRPTTATSGTALASDVVIKVGAVDCTIKAADTTQAAAAPRAIFY